MLWSPIIKNQASSAKHNQMRDVEQVRENLKGTYGIDLGIIANEVFLACLDELRAHARKETRDMKSPIIRLMQVEEHLRRFAKKRANCQNEK